MIRESALALMLVSMVGCAAETAFNPFGQQNEQQDAAQLAAFAATAELPQDIQPQTDLEVAAIIDGDSGAIRLYNFTDRQIPAGQVWVNRNYVQRYNAIPARGFVVLQRDNFYDRTGRTLASLNTPAESVLIQTSDEELYQVLGPVHR